MVYYTQSSFLCQPFFYISRHFPPRHCPPSRSVFFVYLSLLLPPLVFPLSAQNPDQPIHCGRHPLILKKFFVYEPYRGKPHHLGQRLSQALPAFAKENGVKRLILDTPKNTGRAHQFYERAGFSKIAKEELPVDYDYPDADSDFFFLEIL